MILPPELEAEQLDALRAELGAAPAATPGAPPPPEPPGPGVGPAGDRGRLGRLAARAKAGGRARARPVVHRVAEVVAARVVDRAELRERLAAEQAAVGDRLDQLAADVELLRSELRAAMGSLRHLRHIDGAVDLIRADGALDEVHAATVNLELVKAELRTVVARLEDFGQAVAPAAGLEGVAARFAELRERVNALDRRLRRTAGRASSTGVASASAPGAKAPSTEDRVDADDHFDYVGFEARFRGDSTSVAEAQNERYLELLAAHPPVLDIGCGRGELLEALAARGVPASGVDLNAEMVAEAQARGLEVHRADAVAWLRGLPEASVGAIITVHVVEHLELGPLMELLELAASRLVPGGVFVAETPNPASLIVLGNSYILDPTHVRPLHPSLLTFLCERAGFRDVHLEFYAPAEGYHLPRLDLASDEVPPWAAALDRGFAQLNAVLFGPQEYAVMAVTPPAG